MLEYIIIATVLSGLLGLAGGVLLLFRKSFAVRLSPFLVSYAAGALFASAFLCLMPEALALNSSATIFSSMLGGVLVFYFMERFLHWYHHHECGDERCECRASSFSYMLVVGDSTHNFVDGVIIASTFLGDFALGVVTAVAVLIHEIPQEIGDFGAMLHGGMGKKGVLLYNIASALVSVVGAILAYFFFMSVEALLPFILAFAAGGFIYIAGTDLLPETHKEKKFQLSLMHALALVVGVLTIWFVEYMV
ncbi:MAG: ZIP family metal transporter [Candidatus Aenigmatarchaeota archaeon]